MANNSGLAETRHVRGVLAIKDDAGVVKNCHVEGMLTLTPEVGLAEASLPPSSPSHSPLISPVKKPLALLDLGIDVLDHVFDYISRLLYRHDCIMTCKTFYQLMLPRLYKYMLIPVTKNVNTLYAALLKESHPGLKHIKILGIYYPPGRVDEYDRITAAFLIRLIRAMPRGTLENFIGHNGLDTPANVTKLLWQRQPNLRRLELFTEHNDVSDPAFDGLERAFANTTQLYISPRDPKALVIASKALQRFKIDTLCIGGRAYTLYEHRNSDTGVIRNSITAGLFNHLKPSANLGSKWAGLRKLMWRDMSFEFCRHESAGLFSNLDLSTLEILTIRDCTHVDLFLFELYSRLPPKLKKLQVIHDLGVPHPDRTITALNELLVGTKGRLKRLRLVLRNVPEGPDVSIINSHRETLEQLVLNTRDTHGKPIRLEPEKFHVLLRDCFALKQLAANLPNPNLEYVVFDNGVGTGWLGAMNAILVHTSLNILNVLDSPLEDGKSSGYYKGRQPMVQRLATDIFKKLRDPHLADTESKCPTRRKLAAVVFGQSEEPSDDVVPPMMCYMEVEVTCLFNTYRIAQEVKYLELLAEGHGFSDRFLSHPPWKAAQKISNN